MIYILEASEIEEVNGSYSTANTTDRMLAIPDVIDASSTKDAIDLAKEIIDDLYDCDVALKVSTVEKFPMPMFKGVKQDDCCILLELWRINDKWEYII